MGELDLPFKRERRMHQCFPLLSHSETRGRRRNYETITGRSIQRGVPGNQNHLICLTINISMVLSRFSDIVK